MITVSLETAKKMKDVGWKKDTWFYYEVSQYPSNNHLLFCNEKRSGDLEAPTAQEILDELPKNIREDINLHIQFYDGAIEIFYNGSEKLPGCGCCYDDVTLGYNKGDNLTELLAKLRLRCKDNALLPNNK